mgnify:CR=1 FL=1
MQLDDILIKRSSIRNYSNKKVSNELIAEIIHAGTLAPSSGNLQNWVFIVVQDEDKKTEVANAALKQYWLIKAPVLIIVCANLENISRFYSKRGELLYSIQNCAACIENMLLKATDLGLGSCWIGAFDENALSRILKLPDPIRAQAIISIGYAAESPSTKKRYPLQNLTFFEEYGGKKQEFLPLRKHFHPEKEAKEAKYGLLKLVNKLKKKKS